MYLQVFITLGRVIVSYTILLMVLQTVLIMEKVLNFVKFIYFN